MMNLNDYCDGYYDDYVYTWTGMNMSIPEWRWNTKVDTGSITRVCLRFQSDHSVNLPG